MKLGQQLKIKQNQSLIMTPQLQQAIKLLQLTNIELADFIDKAQLENPNVVKVLTKENLNQTNFPEALNFKRNITEEKENIYHHLGIYSYDKDTLEKFVSLKQSTSEIKNKLEQLRAIDNNIKINVAFAKFAPIGVDTIEDLEAVKKIMENKS